MATVEHMIWRQKGGKTFLALAGGETPCPPSHAFGSTGRAPVLPATHVACASTGWCLPHFGLGGLKTVANGGRGLLLIDLEDKDRLAGAAAYVRSVRIDGPGRGGKLREETPELRSLNHARAARGRKGKATDLGFRPSGVTRIL